MRERAGERPSAAGLAASLAAAVRSRPLAELAIVFLLLPALLVAVALVPGSRTWRLSLAADGILASRWTLWTAFASSFVHVDATHLLDNVVNYWLLMAAAYPLSLIAGWRRRLLYAAVAFLAVVPVLSAWATIVALASVTDAPAAGFSGVNNAFLGYLVAVWFAALATERPSRESAVDAGVDPRWSLVVAFGSLAAVFASPTTVGYFPALPEAGALFAVAAIVVAWGLYARRGRPRLAGLELDPARELLYVVAGSVAVAGVIVSLVVVEFGSNVYAHLVGYVVGYVVGFLGILADG